MFSRGLLVIALATLVGCSSADKGQVTVRGDVGQTVLAQTFNQAFISASHDGEYDVVLIQDPAAGAVKSTSTGKPLQPMTASELRQVVHIHVFWQGSGGSVARDGVVTNAAIDWYVVAHEASDRPELLHYQGAGYVLLDEGRKSTSVKIRDGNMKVNHVQGDLRDPIGPSKLAGTVKATRDSQLVRDTLADLKAQVQTSKTSLSDAR